MRPRRSRIETHYLRVRTPQKDKEGNTYEEYGEAKKLRCEVWPASGKVQAEMYGGRLAYIQNMKIIGDYEIRTDEKGIVHYVYPNGLTVTEQDGICLYVAGSTEPDYRIISIKPYKPLRLEVEKR